MADHSRGSRRCNPGELSPGAIPVLSTGGDFALTDYNGQPFELTSLRGKAVLISLIVPCRTSAHRAFELSSVYKDLGKDAGCVRPLYITVDPDRDTPAVLKADLGYFDLDALGLTGTKPENQVAALYGASYEIIPTPQSVEKYTSRTAPHSMLWICRRARSFPLRSHCDDIVKGLRAILA